MEFFASELVDKPGSNYELQVWELVKATFKNRVGFAFLNFPIHNNCGNGRKEIDILVVDRELGFILLEVKGIKIKQIETIMGHKWVYKNFYHAEGNPYQQVENQMFALVNKVNDFLGYPKEFLSKRCFVVLPEITSYDWCQNRLHGDLWLVFKEELFSTGLLAKMEGCHYSTVSKAISDMEWARMKQFFGVEKFNSENGQIIVPFLQSTSYSLPSDNIVSEAELSELDDFV